MSSLPVPRPRIVALLAAVLAAALLLPAGPAPSVSEQTPEPAAAAAAATPNVFIYHLDDLRDAFPGGIWIFRGSAAGLDTSNIYKVYGKPGSRDELGLTVELADVTGEGVVDLISSSGVYSNTLNQQGVVRIFRGLRPLR